MSATGLALPAGEPISRRTLLQAGGTLVGALALGGGAAALSGAGSSPLAGLRRSDYLPWVGATFRLKAGGGPAIRTRLSAVEAVGGGHARASENVFAVVFRQPLSRPLRDQAVVEVHHPAGFTRSLLVTPISRDGLDLAAVINRSSP